MKFIEEIKIIVRHDEEEDSPDDVQAIIRFCFNRGNARESFILETCHAWDFDNPEQIPDSVRRCKEYVTALLLELGFEQGEIRDALKEAEVIQ